MATPAELPVTVNRKPAMQKQDTNAGSRRPPTTSISNTRRTAQKAKINIQTTGLSISNQPTAEQRNTTLPAVDAHIQQVVAFTAEDLKSEGETEATDSEPDKDIQQTLSPQESCKAKHKKASRARQKDNRERRFNLVLSAAKATVGILQKHGIPCAIFGGLACKLYGSSRCPKDVDLLISQFSSSDANAAARTAEEIKVMILDNNPQHFYLKLPRDPEATYRILYYRQYHLGPECKVDILLPGTMHLPNIPITLSTSIASSASLVPGNLNKFSPSPHPYLTTVSDIPLVPFSLLLLHKLQGWDDNRKASEARKQRKQCQDAADVRRLLAMEERVNELRQIRPWTDSNLFSDEFQLLTGERVKEFCKLFPNVASLWQSFGFEIS